MLHSSLKLLQGSDIWASTREKAAADEKKGSIQKDVHHATTPSGSATTSEHWPEFHFWWKDKPPPFTEQAVQENYFA